MPILFCSTKLSALLGLKHRHPSLSMDNWNGHLFFLEGKKCLVFVHKETFYSVVIFNVFKKDLKDIRQLFIDNLIAQLSNDKILVDGTEHMIKKHFQHFDLSTTDGDKSTIGFMNNCITRLTSQRDGQKPLIADIKKYVANHYNDNPIIAQKGLTPISLMREKLKNYVKQ
jgi:hypothetical protein